MNLDSMIEVVSKSYKSRPSGRAKVSHEMLLQSAKEELGYSITSDDIEKEASCFLSGEMHYDESIFESMMVAPKKLAKACFGGNESGSFTTQFAEDKEGLVFCYITEKE